MSQCLYSGSQWEPPHYIEEKCMQVWNDMRVTLVQNYIIWVLCEYMKSSDAKASKCHLKFSS